MKIGIVQTRPVKGDVSANLADHQRWASLAVEGGVDLLVFPELSLTGYEPSLARELATTKDDIRFAGLQRMSDKYGVFIGAGMPIVEEGAAPGEGARGGVGKEEAGGGHGEDAASGGDRKHAARGGVMIGMVIFRPDESRMLYTKQYLHADEEPFFVPGKEQVFLSMIDDKIAPAICYELSVPEHSVNAYSHRANIYLASVAKTAAGMEKAVEILMGIACTYSMTALLVNSVGLCADGICGGGSTVINDKGEVVDALDTDEEGMLIYDTATGVTSVRMAPIEEEGAE